MPIQRFSDTDSTRIWEHLNRLATDAEAEVQAAVTPISAEVLTQVTGMFTKSGSLDMSGSSGGTGGYVFRIGPMQIAAVRLQIKPVANTVSSVTWTYGAPFSDVPAVVLVPSTSADTVSRLMLSGDSTATSCKPAIVRSNTTQTTIYAIAVGPWAA